MSWSESVRSSLHANFFCPFCFASQEPSVREPSESKLCKPPGLRTQHHRQSAIHERRGPEQRHAGTPPWHRFNLRWLNCCLSQSPCVGPSDTRRLPNYCITPQFCSRYLLSIVLIRSHHLPSLCLNLFFFPQVIFGKSSCADFYKEAYTSVVYHNRWVFQNALLFTGVCIEFAETSEISAI